MSAYTLTDRRAALLARIRHAGGEWTRARALGFYARNFAGPVRPAEVRADLAALHTAGHLVRHDTPGRRHYSHNTTGDGR